MSAVTTSDKATEEVEELSNQQLTEEFYKLKKIIEKQSQAIAQTGQQILSSQIKSIKTQLSSLDPPSIATGTISTTTASTTDTEEFIKNDDIVQLVQELQTSLDAMEERNIIRTHNSIKTCDNDELIPQINKYGESVESANLQFPSTLQHFKTLRNESILKLCKFYLLLPVHEVDGGVVDLNDERFDVDVSDFVKEDFDGLHAALGRYIGVFINREE